MRVLSIHERELQAKSAEVGALIDSLASPQDALWPKDAWPRMEFDRPLQVGATGGHGLIRYFAEEYKPGQSVRFRFTRPKGFSGYHGYEVLAQPNETTLLRHTLKMTTRGRATFSWLLLFRPMHDALLEDSLAVAQASLGLTPHMKPWSYWVRFLRWVVSRRQSSKAGDRGRDVAPNPRLTLAL